MRVDKLFSVKIFDQDGTTFLKGFTSKRPVSSGAGYLKNTPSFESRINSGFGECVLDLALPFDDFDEGVSIAMMNIVKIYAVTLDYTTTPPTQSTDTLIYTGFMSKYEPYLNPGGEQGVHVTLLGLVSLTAFSYYKAGTAFSVTHTSVDPATIAQAIITHVNTIYQGSLLSYTGASVDTVGASVTKVFTDRHWSEALEDTRLLSGNGWWSKIDEAGVYWLKQTPSTATHTFTIGKDVEKIIAPKDSEKVINDAQVRWNNGTAQTTDFLDATSQVTYGTGSPATGKRTTIVTDTNLNNAAAANQRGNKVISDNKDAKTKATITVNANYNIESIKVGQTCSVRNLKGSFFADNILIVAVRYSADTVEIELDDFSADFGKELTSLISNTAGPSTSSSSSGSSSTPGFVDREVPTGSINSSNTSFTLSQTPVAGSEMCYLNGVLQSGSGADYTATGTTLAFVTPPETGATLLVSYRTANGTINFVDREVPSGTINGSNVTFTLAHTPTTGSESLYLNGILQNAGGADYSISGTGITMAVAPETGSVLLVSYRY